MVSHGVGLLGPMVSHGVGFGVLDLRCFGVLEFARFCSKWVLVLGC